MTGGLLMAVVALFSSKKYGTKGVLGPALFGLAVSLTVWILFFCGLLAASGG